MREKKKNQLSLLPYTNFIPNLVTVGIILRRSAKFYVVHERREVVFEALMMYRVCPQGSYFASIIEYKPSEFNFSVLNILESLHL